MTRLVGVAALVLAPSLTVVPSVYEVLRQSIDSGRAIWSSPAAGVRLNAEPELPLTICQPWNVVKPSWFMSSGSKLSRTAACPAHSR